MNLMRPGELFIRVLLCTHPTMTGTLPEIGLAFSVLEHGLLTKFQGIVVRLGRIDFQGLQL